MPMPLANYFTAADVRALPDDGNRYETVFGELLVTSEVSGLHQVVFGRLLLAFGNYLAERDIFGTLWAPSHLSFRPDCLVKPDLFVADLAAFTASDDWADIRTVYLAIEITSESSARADRFPKRRFYQQQHIPRYWIVDIDLRQVEVWTPEALFPVIERERLVWRHPAIEQECSVELASLFR